MASRKMKIQHLFFHRFAVDGMVISEIQWKEYEIDDEYEKDHHEIQIE